MTPATAPGSVPVQVGLSFDDGPSRWTGPILDLLATHGARATFFVIGVAAAADPDTVRRIHDDGHELGNHTWSHPALARDCDDRRVRDELIQTSELLERLVGTAPKLFRAPHYDHDSRVDAIAGSLGLRHAGGDLAPADWSPGIRGAVIATLVLQGISPGAVIGLHDGVPPGEREPTATRQPTVEAVAAILPALGSRRTDCLTVSEMIAP